MMLMKKIGKMIAVIGLVILLISSTGFVVREQERKSEMLDYLWRIYNSEQNISELMSITPENRTDNWTVEYNVDMVYIMSGHAGIVGSYNDTFPYIVVILVGNILTLAGLTMVAIAPCDCKKDDKCKNEKKEEEPEAAPEPAQPEAAPEPEQKEG
jgi:hypothetical protein